MPDDLPPSLIDDLDRARLVPVIGWGYPDFVLTPPPISDDYGDPHSGQHAALQWLTSFAPHVWPVFHAVAAMPVRGILAFTPDPTLGRILEYYDEEWLILGPQQATYGDGRRLLVPLGGLSSDPESLSLPGVDHVSLPWRREVLWRHAEAMARSPLLLLGCHPGDRAFLGLMTRLRPYPPLDTPGWLVAHHVDRLDRKRWEGHGFSILETSTAKLLRYMIRRAGVTTDRPIREAGSRPQPFWHRPPYKGLDYFERDEAEIFFGREAEKRQLVDLISAHRLVVVTGPSGAGKTSLLNAGVLAALDQRTDENAVYTRVENDPAAAIRRAVAGGITRITGEGGSLLEFLRHGLRVSRRVNVVVIDQAEELFTRTSQELRDELFATLRDCLVSPSLVARFVLCLREDFLPKLAQYREVIPSLLNNTFVVRELTRGAAVEAMRGPAARSAIAMTEDLVDEVLKDIGIDQFPPPQIQIICNALYEARRADVIDRALYAQLGGARRILTGFLANALAALGCDEVDARNVLKAMVTSEGTKDVLSLAAIANRSGLPLARAERLLLHLRDSARVLRSLPVGRDRAFELAHEYLTKEIWSWMTDGEIKRREVEDMLDREVRSWRRFRHLRLGIDRLALFESHHGLLSLDEEQLTVLLLGAVKQARDASAWAAQVHRLGSEAERRVASVLLDYFGDRDVRQRRDAAEAIAQLDPEPILESLASEKWRKTALEMIGGMELERAIPLVSGLLKDPDPEVRALVCGVLGEISDETSFDGLHLASEDRELTVAVAAIRAAGRLRAGAGYVVVSDALRSGLPAKSTAALDAIRNSRDSGLVTKALLDQTLSVKAKKALWECIAGGNRRLVESVRSLLGRLSIDDLVLAIDCDRLDRDALAALDKRGDVAPTVLQAARAKSAARYLNGPTQERWDQVKAQIAATLSRNIDTESIQRLMLSADWGVSDATFSWLVHNGERAANALRSILKGSDDTAKLKATAVVVLLEPRISLDPNDILELLQDTVPGVRYLACKLAVTKGHHYFVDRLRELSDDRAAVGHVKWGDVQPSEFAGVWNASDTVASAAQDALDRLWPVSKVWRKEFQKTFRQ